jgi:hypothetical protein
VLRATVTTVLCAVLVGACGGGKASPSETRAAQARSVARAAGLSPAVQDLLADAATSPARTFTVSYKLAVPGSTTITQDPPRRRVDLVVGEGPAAVTRSTITNDDGTFACTRTTGAWTCKKTSTPPNALSPMALGDVDQTTSDLAAARKSYTFRVEPRTVAGARARCLVTELRPGQAPDPARGQRGVLCVSADGVPLVIEGGQSTITATRYTTKVDDTAFKLPAKAS